jgi:hypothetical protein
MTGKEKITNDMNDDDFFGYGVDSGTGGFLDYCFEISRSSNAFTAVRAKDSTVTVIFLKFCQPDDNLFDRASVGVN